MHPEHAGWEEVARETGPVLWRLASALAGPEAATELVAEAFTRAAAERSDDGQVPGRVQLTRTLWEVARKRATSGVSPVAPTHNAVLFLDEDDRWSETWKDMPKRWDGLSFDDGGAPADVTDAALRAVASLRADLRLVLTLRDVEGWCSEEVCEVLGIDADGERALLDPARWHVMRAIDERLGTPR